MSTLQCKSILYSVCTIAILTDCTNTSFPKIKNKNKNKKNILQNPF